MGISKFNSILLNTKVVWRLAFYILVDLQIRLVNVNSLLDTVEIVALKLTRYTDTCN